MSFNDKQKQILTTAETLFAARGFEGTSVRDIADEAGVNIAMISYYFGSKEKLMEALFEQRTNDIRLAVESLLKREDLSPLEKMYTLVDDYIERVMEKQMFYKIMLCEQVINKNPVIISLISELKRKNLEEISKIIRDGQDKGVFRKEVDIMLLLITMTGCLTQMMVSKNTYREFAQLQSLSQEAYFEKIKSILSHHIKFLFKALLSHEV